MSRYNLRRRDEDKDDDDYSSDEEYNPAKRPRLEGEECIRIFLNKYLYIKTNNSL